MQVNPTAITPYSSVMPLVAPAEIQNWVPEDEQERIASYFKYDDIYWGEPGAFRLQMYGEEGTQSIYVPNPRTIVDTTAYYLLKGLRITVENEEKNKLLRDALKQLLQRERFYSRFHNAKHTGVARGDYILHITADPNAPEGERISITDVQPHMYFPVRDPDDDTKIIKVHLAEEFTDVNSGQVMLRRLTYEYVMVGNTKRVQRTEAILEVQDWFDPKKERKVKSLLKPELLPEEITRIPVYHFTNQRWGGEHFGRSELSGFESLQTAINQSVTDEQAALALEGLGVYATDAAPPINPETGEEEDWQIAPRRVLEVPIGSFFKRLEGVGSVKPMLDHVNYLDGKLREATGTSDVAIGKIDVQTAQSGIALAIKFIPTLAKIEDRDTEGTELLTNLFYDWKAWHAAYEQDDFRDTEIIPELGKKLPTDRTAVLNELNNMFDRKIISAQYYRERMRIELGYEFPDDIDQQVIDEAKARQAIVGLPAAPNQPPPTSGGDPRVTKVGTTDGNTLPSGSNSNNASRPNESGGTEAGKTTTA